MFNDFILHKQCLPLYTISIADDPELLYNFMTIIHPNSSDIRVYSVNELKVFYFIKHSLKWCYKHGIDASVTLVFTLC